MEDKIGPAPSSAFSGSRIVGMGPTLGMGYQGGSASRVFDTGASRDADEGKPDYDGFLSPLVIDAYGRYMAFNREMADGSLRGSDNWQKGIPQPQYVKSAWRHLVDWWSWTRGNVSPHYEPVTAALGIMFNVMGWLHEELKKDPEAIHAAIRTAKLHRDQARRAKGLCPPDPCSLSPAYGGTGVGPSIIASAASSTPVYVGSVRDAIKAGAVPPSIFKPVLKTEWSAPKSAGQLYFERLNPALYWGRLTLDDQSRWERAAKTPGERLRDLNLYGTNPRGYRWATPGMPWSAAPYVVKDMWEKWAAEPVATQIARGLRTL